MNGIKCIEIRSCENGYIATERSGYQRHVGDSGREHVFESMEHLHAWLKSFFEGNQQNG